MTAPGPNYAHGLSDATAATVRAAIDTGRAPRTFRIPLTMSRPARLAGPDAQIEEVAAAPEVAVLEVGRVRSGRGKPWWYVAEDASRGIVVTGRLREWWSE